MLVRDHMCIQLAAATMPTGRRETAMRDIGYSAPVFWRHVDRLLEDREVVAEYPVEVGRLRRLREARRAVRTPLRDHVAPVLLPSRRRELR